MGCCQSACRKREQTPERIALEELPTHDSRPHKLDTVEPAPTLGHGESSAQPSTSKPAEENIQAPLLSPNSSNDNLSQHASSSTSVSSYDNVPKAKNIPPQYQSSASPSIPDSSIFATALSDPCPKVAMKEDQPQKGISKHKCSFTSSKDY